MPSITGFDPCRGYCALDAIWTRRTETIGGVMAEARARAYLFKLFKLENEAAPEPSEQAIQRQANASLAFNQHAYQIGAWSCGLDRLCGTLEHFQNCIDAKSRGQVKKPTPSCILPELKLTVNAGILAHFIGFQDPLKKFSPAEASMLAQHFQLLLASLQPKLVTFGKCCNELLEIGQQTGVEQEWLDPAKRQKLARQGGYEDPDEVIPADRCGCNVDVDKHSV